MLCNEQRFGKSECERGIGHPTKTEKRGTAKKRCPYLPWSQEMARKEDTHRPQNMPCVAAIMERIKCSWWVPMFHSYRWSSCPAVTVIKFSPLAGRILASQDHLTGNYLLKHTSTKPGWNKAIFVDVTVLYKWRHQGPCSGSANLQWGICGNNCRSGHCLYRMAVIL